MPSAATNASTTRSAAPGARPCRWPHQPASPLASSARDGKGRGALTVVESAALQGKICTQCSENLQNRHETCVPCIQKKTKIKCVKLRTTKSDSSTKEQGRAYAILLLGHGHCRRAPGRGLSQVHNTSANLALSLGSDVQMATCRSAMKAAAPPLGPRHRLLDYPSAHAS